MEACTSLPEDVISLFYSVFLTLTAHVPVFATNCREPGAGYVVSDN